MPDDLSLAELNRIVAEDDRREHGVCVLDLWEVDIRAGVVVIREGADVMSGLSPIAEYVDARRRGERV